MKQGKRVPLAVCDCIRRLLATTDAEMPVIARRCDVARSTVIAINKKYRIRKYDGRRLWADQSPDAEWDLPLNDGRYVIRSKAARKLENLQR